MESSEEFRKAFMTDLKQYKGHCARVERQYSQLRILRQKMEPLVEATVQCDYAESGMRKCSYQNEIAAVFYDQNMISLHPMVVHFRVPGGRITS